MIARFGDGRDWFFEKRFGLFIHWGLYALPAWHEQVQWRKGMPRREYEKLLQQFNPIRYAPDAWLDLAQEAGMEYVTFTTKHVDGFCLWNTAQHDYNVMNTPYGKDVLGMLAEACHRRGFPLCLYYSLADMHHRHYPNQGRNYERPGPEEGDEPHTEVYLAALKEQIRELCTGYGEIHGIWWDANMGRWRDPSFRELIRALQPKAIINNRGFDDGDFSTPERDYDKALGAILAFDRPTEACQAVGSQSWGYREDEDYYADRYLIQSIDRTMARGGNYLLNVGPMADGTIAAEDVRILRKIGGWYRSVKEAFGQSKPASHLIENSDVLLTRRGNTLYVHLHKPPTITSVLLKPLAVLPRKATLLNTGAPVQTVVDSLPKLYPDRNEYLRIRNLPVNDAQDTVLVVKLQFDELPGGPDEK